MSHTTPRHRFARLAAGLAVTAAATATTLLGATPAYAQAGVEVDLTSGTLLVFGTNSADNLTVRPANVGGQGGVDVTSAAGPVVATSGAACNAINGGLRCTGTVTGIDFAGRGGNDSFFNLTSSPSFLRGDAGNDSLLGGQGKDVLIGGPDFDIVIGSGGFADVCVAESERRCELN